MTDGTQDTDGTDAEASAQRTSIGARRNPATAEAIRLAATEILAEKGYAGFSVEAVARRARAGKPTIYRWWPSKAELLLDVYHRQKTGMPEPDTGSLVEDLTIYLDALLRIWRETPSGTVFRSLIAEAQTDSAAARALRTYLDQRLDQSAAMIRRARTRGEISETVDPLLAMELVTSLAWTRLVTDRLDMETAAVRAAVSLFVESWRA
uniref:TetR/AcrR family transcriptional regulator n=1 Tax=Stappia sp. TaxID=1870903 RepID=UPI003BAC4467